LDLDFEDNGSPDSGDFRNIPVSTESYIVSKTPEVQSQSQPVNQIEALNNFALFTEHSSGLPSSSNPFTMPAATPPNDFVFQKSIQSNNSHQLDIFSNASEHLQYGNGLHANLINTQIVSHQNSANSMRSANASDFQSDLKQHIKNGEQNILLHSSESRSMNMTNNLFTLDTSVNFGHKIVQTHSSTSGPTQKEITPKVSDLSATIPNSVMNELLDLNLNEGFSLPKTLFHSSKGLEVLGTFVRQHGNILLQLTLKNHALQAIGDFSLHFNHNR
jgi:hypothetical protein